jgi:hypothetical protein
VQKRSVAEFSRERNRPQRRQWNTTTERRQYDDNTTTERRQYDDRGWRRNTRDNPRKSSPSIVVAAGDYVRLRSLRFAPTHIHRPYSRRYRVGCDCRRHQSSLSYFSAMPTIRQKHKEDSLKT